MSNDHDRAPHETISVPSGDPDDAVVEPAALDERTAVAADLHPGDLTDRRPDGSEADVIDQARPVLTDDEEEWPR